jgi:hypothetical protein
MAQFELVRSVPHQELGSGKLLRSTNDHLDGGIIWPPTISTSPHSSYAGNHVVAPQQFSKSRLFRENARES